MSSRGDTREQPSARDPGQLRAEHIFLIVAAVSLSAAVAAYALDATLPVDLNRGAYSIMVALFVAGYCGWLSRSAERRMRRVAVAELRRLREGQVEVRDALAEIAKELAALRQEVARGRVSPAKRSEGRAYMSTAAGGEGDTVPLMPAVPPETMAVLRRINMKIAGNEDQL